MLQESLERYGMPTLAIALKDITSFKELLLKLSEYLLALNEICSTEFMAYDNIEAYMVLRDYANEVESFKKALL
jgi:hypothetical protein